MPSRLAPANPSQIRAGTIAYSKFARPLLFGLLVAITLVSFELFPSPGIQLGDFGAFVSSGRAVWSGENPYGFYNRLDDIGSSTPNLNPPLSLVVFSLLARIDPVVGLLTWRVIAVLVYALSIFILLRQNPRWRSPIWIAWLAAFPPFVMTITLGQIYTVLLLIVAIAWRVQLSNRPVLAGALIGILVAIKPNFAIWPFLLILTGETGIAVSSFLVVGGLAVLPALLYGPIVYRQWLDAIALTSWSDFRNVSLIGVGDSLGHSRLGVVAAVVVGAVLVALTFRYRPNRETVGGIGLLAGILLAPIGWAAYALFLLPWLCGRRVSAGLIAALGLLSIPPAPLYVLANVSSLGQVAASLPYFIGLLVLLGLAIRDCVMSKRPIVAS